MSKRIEFFVPGKAAPGGSKTPGRTKAGKAYLRPACKRTKPWMETVAAYAKKAYRGPLLDGPLWLKLDFVRERPKSHFGTGRNANVLKANAPIWPTTVPDLTKLLRATEDALTGVIWADDAKVVVLVIYKHYANYIRPQPGVHINVETLADQCSKT